MVLSSAGELTSGLLTELREEIRQVSVQMLVWVVTVSARDRTGRFAPGSRLVGRATSGALVETADLWKPYRLVDSSGEPVTAVAS